MTKLNIEESLKDHLIKETHDFVGTQYLLRFGNGYGASVVKNIGSYGNELGLWELAVAKFTDDDKWHICYDTEITNDVIGYLSDEEVMEYLHQIQDLEKE